MQTESDELIVLKTVVQRLENAGIPYMITGSTAANYYCQPRMTRDIDIVIKTSTNQVGKLYLLFKEDFYVDMNAVEEAVRNRNLFNIIHLEKALKVDMIVMKEGEYRETEFSRRLRHDVSGVNMFMVSPEDLILSKLLWAKDSLSEMQLGDVRNLILFNRDSLDFKYLTEWAGKLAVTDMLEKAKE